MEKRTPNDADDVGPCGQHDRHHWRLGPKTSLASGPFFKTVRAHGVFLGRFSGTSKRLCIAPGSGWICYGNACECESGVGVRYGRGCGRNGGRMMLAWGRVGASAAGL